MKKLVFESFLFFYRRYQLFNVDEVRMHAIFMAIGLSQSNSQNVIIVIDVIQRLSREIEPFFRVVFISFYLQLSCPKIGSAWPVKPRFNIVRLQWELLCHAVTKNRHWTDTIDTEVYERRRRIISSLCRIAVFEKEREIFSVRCYRKRFAISVLPWVMSGYVSSSNNQNINQTVQHLHPAGWFIEWLHMLVPQRVMRSMECVRNEFDVT